jgi:hypothetical protein
MPLQAKSTINAIWENPGILRWILRKWKVVVGVWTGSVWLMIGTVGGQL